MKVAVVHDWLNTKRGGAEMVLADILELVPEADVFTMICNKKLFPEIASKHTITTSFLQKFPRFFKNNPQYLLPFIRRAITNFDFSGYDLVISSSGAWSKNVAIPKDTKHICYCHTPARMLWVDWPAYLDSFHFWGFRIIPFSKLYIERLCSQLRLWDFYSTKNIDVLIANSKNVASRIAKFYHRDAIVIYPGIDLSIYQQNQHTKKSNYYIVISTLAKYKRIDVVVQAFRKNGLPLIIVGDGNDRARLEKLANGANNITFKGFVDDEQKLRLLSEAKALIFPGEEDFGITPIESLASGTPVIAYKAGGVAETIKEGKSGIFFTQPNAKGLILAITEFQQLNFDAQFLHQEAEHYSKAAFKKQFKDILNG